MKKVALSCIFLSLNLSILAQTIDVLDHREVPDIHAMAVDPDLEIPAKRATMPPPGFTSHFSQWLATSAWSGFDFERTDLTGGSYGGRAFAGQSVNRDPVIFIHGNSDKALGDTFGQTGWSASVNHFLSEGYTSAELYATTWGPANAGLASYQYHSRLYLEKIRGFIEAVLAYTGAEQVDLITHSMGVTLTRKAIKGGSANDALDGGAYNLGAPLTASVDAFVGIAGANLGLVSCYLSGGSTPTCGATNGLYPGYTIGIWGPYGVSDILVDLNATSGYEGSQVYTIWSTVDEVIGYGNLVYGDYTSRIAGQTDEAVFSQVPYGHFNLKDLTAEIQYDMVNGLY